MTLNSDRHLLVIVLLLEDNWPKIGGNGCGNAQDVLAHDYIEKVSVFF